MYHMDLNFWKHMFTFFEISYFVCFKETLQPKEPESKLKCFDNSWKSKLLKYLKY